MRECCSDVAALAILAVNGPLFLAPSVGVSATAYLQGRPWGDTVVGVRICVILSIGHVCLAKARLGIIIEGSVCQRAVKDGVFMSPQIRLYYLGCFCRFLPLCNWSCKP